jgi:hypothetical protein
MIEQQRKGGKWALRGEGGRWGAGIEKQSILLDCEENTNSNK